jgi:4-hydroxy-3-methylbut-2-enyl diphosphate reductase
VALGAGAPASHLIDTAADIDPSWLEEIQTVGLTSGASTPELLVRGVLSRLAEDGFTDVQEVATMAEHIRFALPRDLYRHC